MNARHRLFWAIASSAAVLGGCAASGQNPGGAPGGSGSGDSQTFGNLDGGGGGDGGQTLGMQGDDGGGSACQQVVDIKANVTIATPPPFDVVIVADNSDSLSWSHSDLATGFQNFLTNVHGRDVRFFILTTTEYGQSSQNAVSAITGKGLVTWNSSITGVAYTDPVTQYVQTCTDTNGETIACPTTFPSLMTFNETGNWTFTMPPPVAAITSTMTDAEIATQQQAISSAILNLVGGGASEEQPLCTLNRYIAQAASALPSHAVFIVLSDEDDVTPPAHCLASYHFTATALMQQEDSCQEDCQQYIYTEYATPVQTVLSYQCVPEDDDGTLYPNLATSHTYGVPSSYAMTCTPPTSGTCTSDEIAAAQNDCGANDAVESCTFACGPSDASEGCSVTLPGSGPNACTSSFTYGATTYANLADYCAKTTPGWTWSNCNSFGINSAGDAGATQYEETEETSPLVPGASSAPDMIANFKTSATAAFGAGNYQVETIQLDPSFSCPVNPGQSYGTNLKTLATNSADVFSLCGSYADVLQSVQSYANSLIQTAYPLTLGPRESLSGVTVVDSAGTARMLASNQFSYDATTGTLNIGMGVLMSGDASLRVDLAQGCAPP